MESPAPVTWKIPLLSSDEYNRCSLCPLLTWTGRWSETWDKDWQTEQAQGWGELFEGRGVKQCLALETYRLIRMPPASLNKSSSRLQQKVFLPHQAPFPSFSKPSSQPFFPCCLRFGSSCSISCWVLPTAHRLWRLSLSHAGAAMQLK